MFIVTLTGSPFFKSAHYHVSCTGANVAQRSKKRATRFTTKEEAEKIAAWWNVGRTNQFKAAVESVSR